LERIAVPLPCTAALRPFDGVWTPVSAPLLPLHPHRLGGSIIGMNLYRQCFPSKVKVQEEQTIQLLRFGIIKCDFADRVILMVF
jgi:hypothetical protein